MDLKIGQVTSNVVQATKTWLPETAMFIEEMPHTATGKINKLALRQLCKGMFPG